MKSVRRFGALCMAAVAFFACVTTAYAEYVYDKDQEPQESAAPVIVTGCFRGADFGLGSFLTPEDFAVSAAGDIYLADSGNNRIVIISPDFTLKGVLEDFTIAGKNESFSYPSGVFVTQKGELYVADKGNNRIVMFDAALRPLGTVTVTPQEMGRANAEFIPLKVAASEDGRCFVLGQGIYEGLIELDGQGGFLGFLGANRVTPSLMDRFWKSVATKEQRSQLKQFIPTEFSNLDVDGEGFVFTVTQAVDQINPEKSLPVNKINGSGTNILKKSDITGYPIGDLAYPEIALEGIKAGASSFVDISTDTRYGFLALDQKRGRIFCYNLRGELLFSFGELGNVEGTFSMPCAVEGQGDNIYVLDRNNGSITRFAFSQYGSMVLSAVQAYANGEYEQSKLLWEQVLQRVSNLNAAYAGIGRVMIREKNYGEAMEYLRLGGDKKYYSTALRLEREAFARRNFTPIFVFCMGAVLLFLLFSKGILPWLRTHNPFANRAWYRGVTYASYVIFHPFDGFWDMTHERRGSLPSAAILTGVFVLVSVLNAQYRGFLFRPLDYQFNLFMTLGSSLLLPFLWCVCQWSVTTLMEGDGTPQAIFMGTAYCMVPYILLTPVAVVLSRFFTQQEGMLLTVIDAITWIWIVFLILCSLITMHQYTMNKSIGVGFMTIVAMVIVLLLALLFLNLLNQLYVFVRGLYYEISFRW